MRARRAPLSEAIGVGTLDPAGDDEVEAILGFYRDRGAPARVVCGPNTRRGFVVALAAYGFVVVEHQRLLVADLDDVAAVRDERVEPRRSSAARARAAGARFGRTAVTPGSVSERNFLRQGFVDAGERTIWQRR